ncbi:pyrroline-5-carboxylate reductase [Geosmithia morbida]|uniref:Pyrroline-5-carboxylate reductase n=1 Tax=Geosmithia morbida TaxID=1094350 RepID=A0A9P5D2X4_9HYPO|nr:pyrroline-5-carboxylate reductase [Geosmithia morbida]KAF4121235.1 pyrroline-5-carboxylate reductase [Geosmithia morbida]
MSAAVGKDGLTVTVLGCGNLATAIVNGVLSSLADLKAGKSEGTTLPERIPSRFIACVRSAKSAERVETTLKDHSSSVEVVRNDNVNAAKRADVVLLACKPYMVGGVLGEKGMADALRGTILVSVCAGVTVEDLEVALHGSVPTVTPEEDGRCRIIRAMCNTAAMVRQSMTIIATPSPPMSPYEDTLLTWIFKQIGDVVELPPTNMDAVTSLAGSGPAFFALVLEGAIDGGVAMGLPRAEAIRLATQTMRGATALVQSGEHPAILREKVSSPGGCTIGGTLVLEEGAVRGTMARAVREATVIASQLGQGVKNVNGTRF